MRNTQSNNKQVGLGCSKFDIAVYIANQPNMLEYENLSRIHPLTEGEIFNIGQQCGNGWRKVFNVYAKLIFTLDKTQFNYCQNTINWQEYRDNLLLQSQCKTALLFSSPLLQKEKQTQSKQIHIICGKTHALNLLDKKLISANLTWLNNEFAMDKENKLIVCPYFDYRQLSNIKIEYLASLLNRLNWQNY